MIRSPLIIGHRGASLEAPENTLAAFQMALDAGCDGVEFDVQLSRDGVPVVIHDYDLRRTGLSTERIGDLTSQELSQIDVGSWFNAKFPGRSSPSFADETVPSLSSVLALLHGTDALIYIELKCTADSGYTELAQAVCRSIRDSPLLSQMIIKSFYLPALTVVRSIIPDIQTAALFSPRIVDFFRRRLYILSFAKQFGATQISVHHSLITHRLGTLAAEAGMPVTIWTADDVRWIERSRKFGIRAIITNDPTKLLNARG